MRANMLVINLTSMYYKVRVLYHQFPLPLSIEPFQAFRSQELHFLLVTALSSS